LHDKRQCHDVKSTAELILNMLHGNAARRLMRRCKSVVIFACGSEQDKTWGGNVGIIVLRTSASWHRHFDTPLVATLTMPAQCLNSTLIVVHAPVQCRMTHSQRTQINSAVGRGRPG
jgi:hypothetical protein